MRIGALILALAFAILAGMSEPQHMEAAAIGYTDHGHTFTAEEKCGATKGCGGDGYSTHQGTSGNTKCPTCKGNKTVKCSTSNCSTCGGDGEYYVCAANACSETRPSAGPSHYCDGSGGNSMGFAARTHSKTCAKCTGTGYYGKCTRCNGTGKNYKCQNSSCVPNYDADYDNWKTETGYNAVCYTTENTYTIVFNGNGNTGGSTANKTGVKYTAATTLTANGFTKTGYTFNGWNTAANGTGTAYANSASVSKLSAVNGGTATLYAQWKANTYKMIYNPNGGSGSSVNVSHSYNGSYTVKAANTFSRTGYTFTGWNTKADGTGVDYTAGATGTWSTTSNITLYAQWKANSYKVTVNPNGGTYNNTTSRTEHSVVTGNSVTIANPVRKGYTFTGWTISGTPESFTDVTNGKILTVLTENITLTANWSQNEYTVTYNTNGGDSASTTKKYHYGDAIDLDVTPQKNGYVFVGWGTSAGSITPLVTYTMPDLATSSDANHTDWEITLYAIYSMEVSDISGHDYPSHPTGTNMDVYLVIWEDGNPDNYRTYPLTYQYDVSVMRYRYSLSTTDVATFVGNMDKYYYQLKVKDNAGNIGIITEGTCKKGGVIIPDEPPAFPEKEEYLQTVYHYKKDPVTDTWVKFDTTTETVVEGNVFKPAFITVPEGYKTGTMTYPEGYIVTKGGYTVFEEAVNHAYYEPLQYQLNYNANGGSCSETSKTVTYNDYIGQLPTPTRRGYTFTGWYTAANGGTQVLPSQRYTTVGNTTVFAHWQVNTYRITYDYWTNGGTAVSATGADVNYGAGVPLTATATKEGWTFVGWSTNPDAIAKISSLTMSDTNITLYAIYKKDIVVTIVEQTDSGKKTRTLSKTIYNKEVDADFTMTSVTSWSGWKILGWTTETGIQPYPQVEAGGMITLSDSITFHALYEKEIVISYDTNGSALSYDSKKLYAYHNASGTGSYPSITLERAPELSNNSFVKWQETGGTRYAAGETITPTESMHFTAVWDEYPDLVAYDRHFTLEQARGGDITQAELLAKVTATDKEDGTLPKGSKVIVKDYNASAFTGLTADAVVTITYQATDSFENTVTRTITVTVTDTTAKKINRKTYVRFISKNYLIDGTGALRPVSDGGLETTSVWRTNTSYLNLLKNTLLNTKTDVDTWRFTKEDIQEMKKHQTQN